MNEPSSNALKQALLQGKENVKEILEEYIDNDDIDTREKIKILFGCGEQVIEFSTFEASYTEYKLSEPQGLSVENLSVLELAIYLGNYPVFVMLFDYMKKNVLSRPFAVAYHTRRRATACMYSVFDHKKDYFPLLYLYSNPFLSNFFYHNCSRRSRHRTINCSRDRIIDFQKGFEAGFFVFKDEIDRLNSVIMESQFNLPDDLIPVFSEYSHGDPKFCIETLESTLAYHTNRAKELCAEILQDKKKAEWIVNFILRAWFYKVTCREFRYVFRYHNSPQDLSILLNENVKCFFLVFNEFLKNPNETNKNNLLVEAYLPLFSWRREISELRAWMMITLASTMCFILFFYGMSMSMSAGFFVLNNCLLTLSVMVICSNFIYALHEGWQHRHDIVLKFSLNSLIRKAENIQSNKSILDNDESCKAIIPSHENKVAPHGLLAQFTRLFKSTFSRSSAATQEVKRWDESPHPSENPSERASPMEATY